MSETPTKQRWFIFLIHWNHWSLISVGLSLDLRSPNVELHLPFGFIRVGWMHDEPRWPKPVTLFRYSPGDCR